MNKVITVSEVVEGKFGQQVKEGKVYFSYGKFFKGEKLKQGDVATVEIYETAKGNQYINKVLEVKHNEVAVPVAVATAPKTAKKADKSEAVSTTMSKADWAAKDRSQLIGGLSHDAAALAVALINQSGKSSVPEALNVYKEMLEGMLEIREEVQ